MTSGERKLLLIFGIGCLPIIGIIFISLWPYRELIAFLVVGLAVLAVLVILTLHVIRTLTELAVKAHEQKLRQERLQPNERLVNKSQVSMFLPSNTQYQEGQVPYYHRHAPIESSHKLWED